MNAVAPLKPETAREAVQRLFAKELRDGYKVAGCHRYNMPDGCELFRSVRLVHPERGKHMRPMYLDGLRYCIGRPQKPACGWPLYVPPYPLVASGSVFIVEGEACADALAKLGITAVTSGGANSAEGADWSALEGSEYVIWPDHDEAGATYAETVARALRAQGKAVRLLALDVVQSQPPKGDCVDWLAVNPEATAETVRALETVELGKDSPEVFETGRRVVLANAADLEPEAIRWMWPGWLARGKLHVLAGSPGTGKTTIAMDLGASVSAGRAFPGGWKPSAGDVLVWSGEDDPRDTLVPRLIAAGANLERVRFIEGVADDEGRMMPFDPARDVPELALAAQRMNNVALIVVDPLVSAVSGDSHKNAEVRRGLAPLVDLATRLDAALLGITHYTKGSGGREPLERVTGSLAFGALARLVFGTVRMDSEDEADSRRMMLARAKSNIGPDGGGFSYTFEQVELTTHQGVVASRIVWGEETAGSARDLLAEPDTENSDDAVKFLRDLLADESMPAKTVFAEAANAGYSRDQMHRAKRKIGVEASKEGGHFGDSKQQWVWRLPAEGGGKTLKVADNSARHLQGNAPSSGESEAFEV